MQKKQEFTAQQKEQISRLVKELMDTSEKGKLLLNLPPVWMDGDKLDEGRFAEEYLRMHPMRCFNRVLFDEDGRVNEDQLSKDILYLVKDYRKSNLPRLLGNLVTTIKISCAEDSVTYQTDRIHLKNGTLFLNGEFREEKEICINRLPVRYNVNAPPPERWYSFLHDLLDDEDGNPVLCEVNSNAFLQEIERITGKNIAGLYAKHIVDALK